jgi:hypothetical protein
MSIRWLAAIGMATVTTQPSVADVLYTYQTSIRNLLYEVNTENSEPDYFHFLVAVRTGSRFVLQYKRLEFCELY